MVLPSSSEAAEPAVAMSLGTSTSENFLRTSMLSLAAELHASPNVCFGLQGTVNLASIPGGDSDWTPLVRSLIETAQVSPDFSRVRWYAHPYLQLRPLYAELPGGRSSALLARAGVGVVSTEDDLSALQAEGDAWAEATAHQLHPTITWGLAGEIAGRHLALRGWLGAVSFLETVQSEKIQHKSHRMVAAEVVWMP
jgi:hypothetical protein